MYCKRIGHFLVYLAVRLLVCFVQAMPIGTGQMLAMWFAWFFCDVLRIRAQVVDENLAHAFPNLSIADRQRLARRMWEHLFLLVLEVAHAQRKIHETNWRQHLTLRDVRPLVQLLLSDRPTLIITAHFGNFEIGGVALGILGFPTYTVARNLDNPFLDRFLSDFRVGTGQHMIPKNGGYDQILDVLSRGGTMSFLADQHAGPKGCWVEFFGRPASAHKAIALLALDNDAPVAVCAARRLDRLMRFEMRTYAIIDPRNLGAGTDSVRELTQRYTRHLEEIIRREPSQYWWLHRRWKDTRKPRTFRRKTAA